MISILNRIKKQTHSRFTNMSPQLRLFLAGIMLLGIASGIFETTFNNFLHDTFNIDAHARGLLEFPRELPGFLTALFAGMLFFLPETMIAAFCAFTIGLGMIGIAIWGHSWLWMMTFMLIWSTGNHLMMPIRSSVTMHLADATKKGKRLGQVAGAGVAATLIGCWIVWVGMKYFDVGYSLTFVIGGVSAIVAGIIFLMMKLPEAHLKRPSFVWNNKYWLFYTLAFLFGARKQIFITFGPWVLVKIFDQPAYIIAQLWMAAAIIGIFFNPALGRIIDRFGERKVLMLDSVFVFLVCMGYGLSHLISSTQIALGLLYVCYVTDHLLFGVNIARTTYLSKIVVKKEDIAPTLSLGISINHAVSMSIPAVGGIMWMTWGHHSVFMGAAIVALFMMFFSSLVNIEQKKTENLKT